MRYIDGFREGMHISDVYLCKSKQIALTKNGKEYGNLVLQDKTGTVDAKLWDLGSPGVGNFEALDYVYIDADVTMFMGAKQLNVKRIRKADEGEYIPADYLPVSLKDVKQMYSELLALCLLYTSGRSSQRVCGTGSRYGSECRECKMGRRFRQRYLDGQHVSPVLSGEAVPERFFCDEYRIGLR